jgi:cytochrome c peroxidase
MPIPLTPRASTTVRVFGTGFRFVSSRAALHALIDNIEVPVQAFGPTSVPGRDQITVKIPNQLIARGETDLYITADGALSNVVRINCGGSRLPPVGADDAQAQLGRYLFYDKRMSVNGAASCATCHRQDLAFTDGRAQAVGATNQSHPRGSMSLVNVAYNTAFNWTGDPAIRSLEQQALKPMLGTDPIELGLSKDAFLKQIRTDSTYRPLFAKAFPNQADPFTLSNVARAIAAFERTITSSNSPYDRFHFAGDETAISESAKRGEILFYLDGGPSCFRCHSGFNFTDGALHNTGLANAKFKTPTLRNIALTAPYMHDGSIATLEDVIDHYAAGGRDIPGKDKLVHGFKITKQNRADLVAFLKSLTDPSLLEDPRYTDPW